SCLLSFIWIGRKYVPALQIGENIRRDQTNCTIARRQQYRRLDKLEIALFEDRQHDRFDISWCHQLGVIQIDTDQRLILGLILWLRTSAGHLAYQLQIVCSSFSVVVVSETEAGSRILFCSSCCYDLPNKLDSIVNRDARVAFTGEDKASFELGC